MILLAHVHPFLNMMGINAQSNIQTNLHTWLSSIKMNVIPTNVYSSQIQYNHKSYLGVFFYPNQYRLYTPQLQICGYKFSL